MRTISTGALLALAMVAGVGSPGAWARGGGRVSREEFDALREAVAKLAAQVGALRERLEAEAPTRRPDDGVPPPPFPPSPAAPVPDSGQFARAAPDPGAAARESRILEAMAAAPAARKPPRAECRAGLCRLETCYENDQDLVGALSELVSNLTGFQAGSVDRSAAQPGCVVVWLTPQ